MTRPPKVYDNGDGARFTAEPLDPDDPPRPEFGEFLAYWRGLSGERVGPPESALDPIAMRSYLSKVTLVRYDAAEDAFYFGLSGTAIYDLLNREISYTPVRDMRPPAFARMVEDQYREVVETGRPNCYRLCFETPEGSAYYETIRVPLSEDGRTVSGLATVDVFDPGWARLERYIEALYDRS